MRLGSVLLLPYHPPRLQLACHDVEGVASAARRLSLRVWRGRARAVIGSELGGEVEVYPDAGRAAESFRCGLRIQSCRDAIELIRARGPGRRYLALLERHAGRALRDRCGQW